MQPPAPLGRALLPIVQTATRFARRLVHFEALEPVGAKHRSGWIAVDAPSQGVPCTFSANPIRWGCRKSDGNEISLAVWKSAQRGVAGRCGKGSSRIGRAPSNTSPHEDSRREDADLT